jgi:hypothetical protein
MKNSIPQEINGNEPSYPLPTFLAGRCTEPVFIKWLNVKADSLLTRDKKREKPYAFGVTQAAYKELIYKAVMQSGPLDPYSGDPLAWELIGTWDPNADHSVNYAKQFSLMPTVDHITQDALDFEICSWQVNECKSYMAPEEFIGFCDKVARFRDMTVPLDEHM